jgi:hypothetical protein
MEQAGFNPDQRSVHAEHADGPSGSIDRKPQRFFDVAWDSRCGTRHPHLLRESTADLG